jgi:hypothetical protein
VFVSIDGGPFEPLVSDTIDTSTAFTAEAGRSYGFYSVARDYTGNLEEPPLEPDVVRGASSTCGDPWLDCALTAV